MYPRTGLGINFNFGDMAKNIASSVMAKLPDIGINLIAPLVVSKLAAKAPAAKKSKGGGAAQAEAAPAAVAAPRAPRSGLPSWVLPVGIGVGVVVLLGGVFFAVRRKQ